MPFEIKSCEIISIERHARLRNQVRANVRVALVEDAGSHILNLKLRVLAAESAPDQLVRQAVLGKATQIIDRTISAIDQHDVPAAAE